MPHEKKTTVSFKDILGQLHDEQVSSATLSRLSGTPSSDLAAFAKTWVDLSAERRRHIARRMVELAENDFKLDFDLLVRYMLTDEDAEVRAAGIEGLWEAEDAALVKPMIGFLRSDPDARVRAAAADALGHLMLLGEYGRLREHQTELIGEALLATTRSELEDVDVRCHAVEAIAYWSDDIVREVIEMAYDNDTPEMRASAVVAMGHTVDSDWRSITEDELQSPDARMRFEAARASGELENRKAVPRLIELLSDEDREVQGAAIVALGQIGGPAAKKALQEATQSDDEVLSELASDALEELAFASDVDFSLLDIDTESDTDPDIEE